MSVAYVVRSWPRLTQTFVVNEVLALERIGVDVAVFAMTRGDDAVVQPQVSAVRAPVRYLDERAQRWRAHVRVAVASPRRYASTLVFAVTHRGLFGGYTQSGSLQAFDGAVAVADVVRRRRRGPRFTHIHAHFAHDPALVGLLSHRLSGLPYSFTAHARDLYQIPPAALAGRARKASAVVTCCRANAEHIAAVVGEEGPPVELIYHGVDLARFRPGPGRGERGLPVVLSVGRLVEKKGFDDLLHACAQLVSSGRRFRCDVYGDGPARSDLEALRDRLGLAEVVRFYGARTQDEVLAAYHGADLFVLTPRVTADGDRDGVPNVLVEAMACGLPVVSTPVGGVPELVSHGADGFLVPAGDPAALAACVRDLLDDQEARGCVGAAAAVSAARFDGAAAALRLAALFGSAACRA